MPVMGTHSSYQLGCLSRTADLTVDEEQCSIQFMLATNNLKKPFTAIFPPSYTCIQTLLLFSFGFCAKL